MEILNQSPIMEMDPSYKSLAFKLLVAIIIGFFATVFCVCCGGDWEKVLGLMEKHFTDAVVLVCECDKG